MPTPLENAIKPPTFNPGSAGLKSTDPNVSWASVAPVQQATPNVSIGSPFATGPLAQQAIARANRLNARGNVLDARQGVIDLNNPQNPLRYAYNQAGQRVLTTQRAAYPLQRNVIGAKAAVIGAEQGQTAAERALLAAEYGANSARVGELADIRAGKADVADLTAVGLMNRYRRNRDSFLSRFGVQAPEQIELPEGVDATAFGTEAATKTRAQRAEERATENEKDRTLSLAALKLGVQGKGLDVKDARSLADLAGVSLDYAEQAIREAGGDLDQAKYNLGLGQEAAGYGSDLAGLQYERAGLSYEQSQEPPFPGAVLWMGPSGQSEWVTPGEKDDRDYQYRLQQQQSRYPQQYAQQQWQQQYQQQQETGGTEIGALSVPDLLLQYNMVSPTQQQTVFNELVRRAQVKGLTYAQAQAYAQQIINNEMAKRRQQAQSAAGGGGLQLATPVPLPTGR